MLYAQNKSSSQLCSSSSNTGHNVHMADVPESIEDKQKNLNKVMALLQQINEYEKTQGENLKDMQAEVSRVLETQIKQYAELFEDKESLELMVEKAKGVEKKFVNLTKQVKSLT